MAHSVMGQQVSGVKGQKAEFRSVNTECGMRKVLKR